MLSSTRGRNHGACLHGVDANRTAGSRSLGRKPCSSLAPQICRDRQWLKAIKTDTADGGNGPEPEGVVPYQAPALRKLADSFRLTSASRPSTPSSTQRISPRSGRSFALRRTSAIDGSATEQAPTEPALFNILFGSFTDTKEPGSLCFNQQEQELVPLNLKAPASKLHSGAVNCNKPRQRRRARFRIYDKTLGTFLAS